MPPSNETVTMTEREMAIARKAAAIAVEQAADELYRQVGKSVLTRIFVWIGLLALGFGAAKGWIKWPG